MQPHTPRLDWLVFPCLPRNGLYVSGFVASTTGPATTIRYCVVRHVYRHWFVCFCMYMRSNKVRSGVRCRLRSLCFFMPVKKQKEPPLPCNRRSHAKNRQQTRYHPVRAAMDIPSLPWTTSSNRPPTRTSSYALYVPRYPPSNAIERPCRRISSVSRTPRRRPSVGQRPPRAATMLRRPTVVAKGPPATTMMRTKQVGWQRRG